MKRKLALLFTVVIGIFLLTSCAGTEVDYETLRDVSWEGTELTIKLGENKSTGCVWKTHPEDDSVIDYSLNRTFKLANSNEKRSKAIGTLEAGFKGKGAGTTQILCTTPVGWDGSGDGLTYIVTVTVNEDGTIKEAKGEESESAPEAETEQTEQTEQESKTLEDYFNDHPDVYDETKRSVKNKNTHSDFMDIDLEVEGNTLSYIYTLKKTYSDEEVKGLKEHLENSFSQVESENKDKIKTLEEAFGVDNIKIRMEYRNGDGSMIFETTMG